jgi:hypothetical protein
VRESLDASKKLSEVVCGAINSTGNPISILAAERDADNIIAPFDAANDFKQH